MKKGVSVIICCYNSAARLPQTLRRLAEQVVPPDLSWEIILVDNASTDDTARIAADLWRELTGARVDSRIAAVFRIADEPRPGQMHARRKGAREACFDCLIFCDDDNWLDKDYVSLAAEVMQSHLTIGAAGGQNHPVTDAAGYPEWFEEYKDKYAIGIPAAESGDVTYKGFVLGAGLVTRRQLFLDMFDDGYPSLLNGRNGEKLSTGDDFEYCKRLLLRGYRLYYEARMRVDHFIPKERLTIAYRDRLMQGIADAGKVLDEYDIAIRLYNRYKKKNRWRLLALAPFRVFLTVLRLSGRNELEERLTTFYLFPGLLGGSNFGLNSNADGVRIAIKRFIKGNAAAPLFEIYSFYNHKVNPKVPRYQKAVFRKFGLRIHHIVNEAFSHGDFLNHVCRNVTAPKYLIVFDIDCIPTNRQFISRLLADLESPHTLAGAAQTANHLREGKNLYISPFFFAISTAYLRELGYPDMRMTDDMDAGQNLSEQVLRNGGTLKYWWPTHIEKEEWDLFDRDHPRFGPGTTYNDCVYHAFYSRFDLADRFIIKCKTILSTIDRLRFAR